MSYAAAPVPWPNLREVGGDQGHGEIARGDGVITTRSRRDADLSSAEPTVAASQSTPLVVRKRRLGSVHLEGRCRTGWWIKGRVAQGQKGMWRWVAVHMEAMS